MDKIFLVVAIILELLGIPEAQSKIDFLSQKIFGEPVYARQEQTVAAPREEILALPKIAPPAYAPKKIEGADEFKLQAAAGILVDSASASVLFSKEADKELPVASITKLMTALVVLDKLGENDEITVSQNAVATQLEGSSMGLFAGEKITVHNLLYGMLINSANDAALSLAEATAGSEAEFVKLMNEKARRLGLSKTIFSDATGLSGDNKSTVRELSYLARFALRKAEISTIVQVADAVVTSSDGQIQHYLKTTNWLLRDKEIHFVGLKTGFTDAAGQCLLAVAEQNEKELVSVVLASPDRFTETKELMRWGYSNFSWQ